MFDESMPAGMPAATHRTLRIEFTGSGSEYFRIWIVNLLLSLVTLGLYLPFAKARRLRYFYGNTLVDGHALAFHGDPWRMLRGFLLLVVFGGVYAFAGHVSPKAGLLAFCALAAMWPALWRSSLRFRLGNTSWRGLRFAFRGELAGAYKALLPVYLPALVLLLPQVLIDPAHPQEAAKSILAVTGLGMLLMLAIYPLGFALIKRYQHGGYACAGQQTRLEVGTGRFYLLCLKGFGMYLGAMFLLGVVLAIGFGMAFAAGASTADAGTARILGFVVGLLFYLAILALLGPWFTARTQDLVWSGTVSTELRFTSRLSVRALAGLTLANWLLTAVTLGLYRPFAAIRTTRMRLQAVSIALAGDIEQWTASREAQEQDASGDAAGDFFGIDLGL